MLQRIGYDIELEVSSPTTLVAALLVRPEFQRDLREPEAVAVTPDLHVERYLDSYGNRCMRIAIPAGVEAVRLTLDTTAYYSGETDVIAPEARQHEVDELPSSVLQFLLSSRYCEVDSELMQLSWDMFGGLESGWAKVQAVCDFVHDRITFDYQRADPRRTAVGAYRDQVGVCRDFTSR
jgi:transglutaminase-like putative cysteine protease